MGGRRDGVDSGADADDAGVSQTRTGTDVQVDGLLVVAVMRMLDAFGGTIVPRRVAHMCSRLRCSPAAAGVVVGVLTPRSDAAETGELRPGIG